ncbi:MAG: periplasmic sensor signal transduction histidine kinase [Candidatus Sulfotelmatobacter sp.]|nr:periplasmic sensor signal transduction histidine kinase [Candidatus Sulfotelmatobacter sp.]
MGSSPLGKPDPTFRKAPRKRVRLLYERRVSLFSLFVALPGMLVSGFFTWLQPWLLESKIALTFAELFVWWLLAMALQEQTTRPLQTLSNVIAALREEDYSFRARGAATDDALGELSLEVNALADLLADQRIRAIEATALLRRVVEEIEVPLFTFDPDQVLRLVNSAGEQLLQKPSVRLLGRTAKEIGLDKCLSAESETLVPLHFHYPNARWLVRRSSFRQKGVPHTLIVLSDVSRALREEERGAWQRLIRVLGHELNNSLTPIKSIAGSLNAQVSKTVSDANARQDFERGLTIIGTRADSLNRFLQAYRRLAQMPPPVFRKTDLSPIVERVAGLETRLRVQVIPGTEAQLMIDSDQFEQMLINLVRNAVEAALEPPHAARGSEEVESVLPTRVDPQVVMQWEVTEKELVFSIDDNGPGFLNPSNAFVPFYTTKPAGSGIGLVLCRQIAEAHGGSIELLNQSKKRGCRARVVLPRMQPGL